MSTKMNDKLIENSSVKIDDAEDISSLDDPKTNISFCEEQLKTAETGRKGDIIKKVENVEKKCNLNEERGQDPSNEPEMIETTLNDELDSNSTEEKSKKIPENVEKPREASEAEWVDLLGSGSIMKKVLVEGIAESRPERYQVCTINYVATLENGEEVERKDNFEFRLGDFEIVQGLDVAVGLMNRGEKCKLIIKPRLAYGSLGLKPNIPGDVDLTFEVELISVADEDDPESQSFNDRRLKGNAKRNRGNWYYSRGEYLLSVECYRRALQYINAGDESSAEDIPNSEMQAFMEERINVYNNLAAAQIKLEMYEESLISLEKVLCFQPRNIKALYRKAKVYKAKLDMEGAFKWIKKALEVAPNDKDIQKEKYQIATIIETHKKKERELARKMINSSAKENKGKKVQGKGYIWGTIGAGVMALVVGLAAYKLKNT